MTTDAKPSSENKALRLARYLKGFVSLRSTTVRDVSKYESVLWFGDFPQESECESPAWNDDFDPGGSWLEVHKQQFPKPPPPPDIIVPWVDVQLLKRSATKMPELRPTRLVPDLDVEISDGEDPPLVEQGLHDCPEVASAYERYRPSWEAWSTEYQRRESIQRVYAELFRLHTQVRKQGELVELVLGLGLLAWRSPVNGRAIPILRHMVTARVDIHFEPATGLIRLEVGTDGAQLRIEDDMLEAELRPERSYYASVQEQLDAIGDDIWDLPSMFTALKAWAGALHPDSAWSPDLKPDAGGSDKPMVSFAPALILRKRTQVGMVRIYDAIIDRLGSNVDEVPPSWRSLIDDENDQDAPELGAVPDAASKSVDQQETYFPLPANREQNCIVEAINRRRGVLVQGPPGTGKSHTIANLMCHLLATGKRVLVTAETGRALQVLKDKLPEELQPLCVSLLGQGSDAFAELNTAVQGITSRFATWSPGAYNNRINEIDHELDASRRSMAKIDSELRSLRADETSFQSLMDGAYQGSASAIAEQVASERKRFGWLRVPDDAGDDTPVTEQALETWLRICRGYDHDAIKDSRLQVIDSESLPTPANFGFAVSAEREAKIALDRLAGLQSHVAYDSILALETSERTKLAEVLRALIERRKKLDRLGHCWLAEMLAAVLGGRPAIWQALLEQSQKLVNQIEQSIDNLGSSSVSIPVDKDANAVQADAAVVIEHLNAGGKWTNWGLLTPKLLKERTYLRDQVTVDGQPANTQERLKVVCVHLVLRIATEELEQAWAEHGGLPKSSQYRVRLAAIKEHISVLESALDYARTCLDTGHYLTAARPSIPEPDWFNGQSQEWLEIIEASVFEERYRAATKQATTSLQILKSVWELHDTHPAIGSLIQAVEQRDVTAYSRAYSQVQQIEQTRRDQLFREETEAALNAAIPGLVDAVMDNLNDRSWDERIADWKEAWRWAIADNWLRKRIDFNYQQQLWQRRHDTEITIGRLLAASASLRAWTYFFNRINEKPAVSAALKAWRGAVQAMGKGTGRSAKMERLRREARQYMDQCREAIPVWIMPRYLVAEMVDPAPGRYDLVIVDEASQLGIESLFLFYIAKKMVVVGDDQQISPYGVGIADEAIANLQNHYLEGIKYQYALSAQSSLYGNAKIRFGQNIVLREHFRCMPEIIQFSNDLCYASNGTPLDPLRAYPANRLQPIVVRHVPNGYRTGSSQHALNEPEADALMAQIIACIDDPRYAGLTMGIISLQGEAQAKLIESKLLERLEPEVIEERRLICGDAYAFQGDERHVLFLSMVAAPNVRIGALAAESARQRFNVAASRAQDQLWLFHSATLDVLSPTCMRHRLLSYMMNPHRQQVSDAERRFESQFERNVYDAIVARGFFVRTQVCVGDPTNHRYRIDLVVEGMQGRLAVECDGDQWHGPDRYEQDMARQRDLERAGWQFVRIRGGDFYRDRAKSMEPLWAELESLGIRPGGVDETAAEPPPPADIQRSGRKEVDEVINVDSMPAVSAEGAESSGALMNSTGEMKNLFVESEVDQSLIIGRTAPSLLEEYIAYDGPVGPDPRTASIGAVAESLCRIIEVEGPMIAKRAYDIYLRACGIKRLGGELKSTLNKALASVVRQGRVISENEAGKSGMIYSTVRVKGSPHIKLRARGPRIFDEIPPRELRAVGRYIIEQHHFEPGSDEHLRAVLECFDLKRLTTHVGTALLEILDRQE